MNCVKPETRGHKDRGYEVHVTLWPVAARFMPACFGFDAFTYCLSSSTLKIPEPVDGAFLAPVLRPPWPRRRDEAHMAAAVRNPKGHRRAGCCAGTGQGFARQEGIVVTAEAEGRHLDTRQVRDRA